MKTLRYPPEAVTRANAELVRRWNDRPREDALIALVQEAAGENERLHRETVSYRAALNRIAHPLQYGGKQIILEDAEDIARKELIIGAEALGHFCFEDRFSTSGGGRLTSTVA